MHQHHLLKLAVGFGVADDAHPRRQASARAHEVQAFARQQIVDEQRARGFAAHHNGVTHLNVLQLRGERAIGHLDAQKLQVLFVVGAGNAVGAQERLAPVLTQANHGEVAIRKTQARVAGGGKAEQAVGPVVHA